MIMEFKGRNGQPGDRHSYPETTEEEFNDLVEADLDPDRSAGSEFAKKYGKASGRTYRKIERLEETEEAA